MTAHGHERSQSNASASSDGFPQFARLPPEIRCQIFVAAIPTQGINFFNVHSWPNDHEGCNLIESPPRLRLDVRRLSIDHNDDDVFQYDPSVWQVRLALRQTCREARTICNIPSDKLVTLTLEMPKRGLFVKPGDEKLFSADPASRPPQNLVEPIVRRLVQVHVDEMCCFSVENCSFNMTYQYLATYDKALGDHTEPLGYTPRFAIDTPLGIRREMFCFNICQEHRDTANAIRNDSVWTSMFAAATGVRLDPSDKVWRPRSHLCCGAKPDVLRNGCVMIDEDVASHDEEDGTPFTEGPDSLFFRDRFGDIYVEFHKELTYSSRRAFATDTQLRKVVPEQKESVVDYAASAKGKGWTGHQARAAHHDTV